ncbi:glutamate synthase large subunit [Alphaproteobacteria bacterium]|nr:glutamate synthase large subunit [Alphaproteobacteria bacterium]
MYRLTDEHDSCGVGVVVSIDGRPRRDVVKAGIDALKAVWHRGAVGGDGKTGDGAGIHLQIPQDFFKRHIARTGHEPSKGLLAVGMVFLPKTDLSAQESCRGIVEAEILRFGHTIYGWRQVPVDASVVGAMGNASRPEIEQIMIANGRGVSELQFERDLYIIRRRIENAVLNNNIKNFYICSLSCRSIIYKGMFLAEQLTNFFPDLLDERFVSSFAIYHQRYSTNTFPTWELAQPFRVLAHNGEINTLKGNVNWMRSHEVRMTSNIMDNHIESIKPIVQPGSSDSAALDSVFELLVRAGRDLPMVKTILIPESWSNKTNIPEPWRAMYSYCNSIMEPWDGPAAIAATDGRWIIGGMDRNGLRPMRYTITDDKLLFIGSETGMVSIDESNIIEKGRIGPGEMIAVDLAEGRLYKDIEIKDTLAGKNPYEDWVKNIFSLENITNNKLKKVEILSENFLRHLQVSVGQSLEDVELILQPMVETGKEATGSMGDDTPIAVLSEGYRGLHHFFRQQFSQVTNPPIDSLRERRVMSLKTRLGNLGNLLEDGATNDELLVLESPILLSSEFLSIQEKWGNQSKTIDCTFDINSDSLPKALTRIKKKAEEAVREGVSHLVLDDSSVNDDKAPVPMILATGAVHSYLVENGLRTYTSINVKSAECLDVHYFAVLIGVGATTINAYLAEQVIYYRHKRGLFKNLNIQECLKNFKLAVEAGLLKIMSKMGIAVISSYRGGYNFEAVGLSRTLVGEFFPGMVSRISGIGLSGIEHKVIQQHIKAFSTNLVSLPVGGLYRYRFNGETHAFDGTLIHKLQHSLYKGSYQIYRQYSQSINSQPPVSIRDLLDFQSDKEKIEDDAVESITEIRKRFVTGAMSLGALSPEAHETLAIAMNRIGAKSDSGEGGESQDRFLPRPDGNNANSEIKQVASGRFGVTAEYLNQCSEIEIKIAQGAKPGEGGQLPGFKVTKLIAKLRHSTEGVTLISPPPHHDIYSIEDLAQLIYDLKQINPRARVNVKLVAEAGIGTIAAGVAKANADVIMISGHSGGTGASPQTSIKYAGVPWEMGLTEVNQVLSLNRLRHRVLLRVDGGLRTGRDIVIAALMGAEEYGIGTMGLVAMGCILVRQCHSNTCPVGVCTQDDDLRKKFEGSPEKVVNLMSFIAREVREILARLGYSRLEDIIGRTDLLSQVSRGSPHLDDLDLNPLLVRPDIEDVPRIFSIEGRNEVPDTLDKKMIEDAKEVFERGEKMQLAYSIRNTQRAIGTRFSSMLVRKFGPNGLKAGHITLQLRGSAGQSLGAFALNGLKIVVDGDSNDYVGKGLSGGTIVLRPAASSKLISNENTIIGNTVLYGATSGKLFAAGQAGERFAVRNSGAEAVVEGCGTSGCEYMTGGTVVILGNVGDNFAAGMTGGMAFIFDDEDNFSDNINLDHVEFGRINSSYWEATCKDLVKEHFHETGSKFADDLLIHWDLEVGKFWQVVPKETIKLLEEPLNFKSVS